MSHVVVLGAGIIGISTACYLHKAGQWVTVAERNAHAGMADIAGHNISPGWTLSCGCAKVVSDLLSGRLPAIAMEGLTLAS